MDTENQHFEKMKNTPEDIIILQMSTINDNHMNRQIFFVILDHFLPFTPLTTQKIKILKK